MVPCFTINHVSERRTLDVFICCISVHIDLENILVVYDRKNLIIRLSLPLLLFDDSSFETMPFRKFQGKAKSVEQDWHDIESQEFVNLLPH